MTKQIPLSRGLFATVDDADFDWLNQWKWSALKVQRGDATPKFYACRMEKRGETTDKPKMILMHRQIMNAPQGRGVDHRNLNTLDYQRANLRMCNQGQNSLNQRGHSDRTSKYKGLYWHKQNRNWVASFRGKHIGCYRTEDLAAAAYDAAAYQFSPEFALLNADMRGAAQCLAS